MSRIISAIFGLLICCAATQAADRNEENEHAAVLGAIGGSNLSASAVAAFSAEPFSAVAAEVVAFGTGLGLKALPAALVEPDDVAFAPTSADQCTLPLRLPQSKFSYVNIFGFDIDGVPDDWGLLGTPELFHWDSDVSLRVNHPLIELSDSPVTNHIPSGIHPLRWEATTQINLVADVAFPTVMLAYAGYSKLKAPAMLPAAVAGDAAKTKVARERFFDALEFLATDLLPPFIFYGGERVLINSGDAGENVADALQRDTVGVKVHEQLLTVYDVRPPVIRYDGVEQADGAVLPPVMLEAMDFGGLRRDRIDALYPAQIESFDPCRRTASLSNDLPDFLPIGSSTVTWIAADQGPTQNGGVNQVQAMQNFIVADTQGPIMVTPPGRVVEIPAGQTSVASADVALGLPRVVDLADPAPRIYNDVPERFPIDSRTPVTWRAVDASSNESTGEQLITIKAQGSNTSPVVADIDVQTLTSEPLDIVLRGSDSDEVDGRFDPLALRLESRPANGDFVAPLLPFFIEDFRSSPSGPYGEGLAQSSDPGGWFRDNVCTSEGVEIRRDWPSAPKFIHVEDGGDYYLIDQLWRCRTAGARAQPTPRISKWNAENAFLGEIQYNGQSDTFVADDDGFLYQLNRNGQGASTRLLLTQRYGNIEDATSLGQSFSGDSWTFESGSARNDNTGVSHPINPGSLSYAHVDSRRAYGLCGRHRSERWRYGR